MKNKLYLAFLIFSILIICIFTEILVLLLNQNISPIIKYSILSLVSFLLASDFIVLIISSFLLIKKRENIRESFDLYIEESISIAGVGLIVFNEAKDIIWISKFVEERVGKKIIGIKLNSLSKSFNEELQKNNPMFRFNMNGAVFQSQVDFIAKTVVIKDVTNEDMVMSQYISEKSVIAEIEIDNFQQLQVILPEEELFKVQTEVIKMLDDLVNSYNLIYLQYSNGKYFIYTNQSVLNTFIEEKFNFLDKIRAIKIMNGVSVSASMGVGSGSSQNKELIDLAKEGLIQALARGGDQVSLIEYNKKPIYFGSKSEIVKLLSKVKIKQISKLIEKIMNLDSIKKVIIYGHVFADLDAVGAALGMSLLAKEFDKEVVIQNNTFDSTTEMVLQKYFSKEEREIFVKKSKAIKMTGKSDTLIIIVDTADLSRIENDKSILGVDPENVFVFDHHRITALPKKIPSTNIYIDTTASSSSEIVSEVLQFVNKKIKPPKQVAQMLLNGIYLDTKQFGNSTSSRTFAAAAWLEYYGALSSISSEILKLPAQYSKLVSKIISLAKEVKQGYFVSSYGGEVPQDIISLAADEILRVQGRKAAIVIAKLPNKQEFKMSARGINTNVQVIADSVGGGGHFAAAAATSKEPLEIFKDNIIQAIISTKEGE